MLPQAGSSYNPLWIEHERACLRTAKTSTQEERKLKNMQVCARIESSINVTCHKA